MSSGAAQLALRFLVGGAVVSFFAVLGEVFRPKSFAGLFGAAPSIALATLGITIARDGAPYASEECRSMILGAVAFLCYAAAVSSVLMRYRPPTMAAAAGLLPIWFGVSFGLLLLLPA